jgi:signal peptide peptidase SppA
MIPKITEADVQVQAIDVRLLSAYMPAGQQLRYGGQARVSDGVAVIGVYGPLVTRQSTMLYGAWGWTITEELVETFQAAVSDSAVKAIILDIDSPGGVAWGTAEASQAIYDARGKKPIYAIAHPVMASAVYWIGSAADKVYAVPSGEVGSIGVVSMHVDYSEALKTAGIKPTIITSGPKKAYANPYEPLSDEDRQRLQAESDAIYGEFLKAVARNRGMDRSTVEKTFGGGLVFSAKEALAVGMIDKIGTLDDVVERIQAKGKNAGKVRRAMADIALARLQTNA